MRCGCGSRRRYDGVGHDLFSRDEERHDGKRGNAFHPRGETSMA